MIGVSDPGGVGVEGRKRIVVDELTPSQAQRLIIYLCGLVDAVNGANLAMTLELMEKPAELPTSAVNSLAKCQRCLQAIMALADADIQAIIATPNGPN